MEQARLDKIAYIRAYMITSSKFITFFICCNIPCEVNYHVIPVGCLWFLEL